MVPAEVCEDRKAQRNLSTGRLVRLGPGGLPRCQAGGEPVTPGMVQEPRPEQGKEAGHGVWGNTEIMAARFQYRRSILSQERQKQKVKTKSLKKFLKLLEASLKTLSC